VIVPFRPRATGRAEVTRARAPDAPLLRRTLNAFVLVAGVCPAFPRFMAAQETTVRADVSASTVRYGESMRTTAIGFTPEVVANWPRAIFRVVGSYSQLSGGGSALQGSGGFSLYTPNAGPLMAELEAFGGGSRTGSSSTNQVLGIVRAHVGGVAAGAWIGAGLGAGSDGLDRHPSRQGEFGGWIGRGAARASFSLAPTVIDDTVRYTDVNVSTGAYTRRFEITAVAGARSGSHPGISGTPVRSWASATLTSRITAQLALIAGAGRYPVDLTQGFPGGPYASVGVRIGSAFSLPGDFIATSPPPRTRPPPPMNDGPLGPLQVTTLPNGRRLLFVRAQGAQSIELTGDFNQWRPIPMLSRPDDWWSVELDLSRGRYELAIRVDGSRWSAPPGLLSIRDEFGGEAGLLDLP
jgi:hypothetical protein